MAKRRKAEGERVFMGFNIGKELWMQMKSRALAEGMGIGELWVKLATDYVASFTPEMLAEKLCRIEPVERLSRIHSQADEAKNTRTRTR